MAEPISHIGPPRRERRARSALRRVLAGALAGLAVIAALGVCVHVVAHSGLVDTLDYRLERLADPASWSR